VAALRGLDGCVAVVRSHELETGRTREPALLCDHLIRGLDGAEEVGALEPGDLRLLAAEAAQCGRLASVATVDVRSWSARVE